MKSVPLAVLAAAIASLGLAAPALAQANRTFVSGSGSDANPCSLGSPCRSFAQALTQTNPGGEIAVLDTAGYGSVTINKAVSIVNQDGVEAGVTITAAGDAITVAAGAGDVVNLRGLTVVGLGVGTNGITLASGHSLTIDKCVIRGFTAGGINVQNSAATALTVTDTTVSNNFEGVFIGGTATSTVTLARLHATGNGATGISAVPVGGVTIVTVGDSLIDHNGTGIVLNAAGGGMGGTFAFVKVDNSKIVDGTGTNSVSATGAGSTVTLGRTLIDLPELNGGGHFQSWGNNQGLGPTGGAITF